MNANEFSDALVEIHGSYVAEAVTYRKRGRWIPWAAAAACLVLIANLFFPTSAPVTPTPTGGTEVYWAEGVPLSLPQMGESELTVESVRIDMDIQTLYHHGTDCMGTAVIEMVLQNPTNEAITVPMTLPCGQAPRYVYTYDEDYNSLCTYPVQSLYRFSMNGTTVHAEHLITATDAAPDRERIQATKLIRLDSPVTKYTYRITELEESENPRITLWGFSPRSDYIVLMDIGPFYEPLHSEQELSIPIPEGDLPEVGETITVYVIGQHPEFKPGWYFKDWSTKERLEGATVLESSETTTFLDFAAQSRKEAFGISKENWAFSVAAELNPFPILNSQSADLSVLSTWSRHWMTYELTLAPGETATHRMELPLYPDYSKSNTYHLDLRSLRVLNPAGSQMLTLSTPFEMTKTSAEWTQTEDRYQLDLQDLTGSELQFQLTGARQIDPDDPDLIVITTPRRDWLTWLCAAVLAGLFFLHLKYRKERI